MVLIKKLVEAQEFAVSHRPEIDGFPFHAEVLRQADVQLIRWSLPSCQAIYLMKEGNIVQQGQTLVTGSKEVPKFNRDALIKAIQKDREGKSTFTDFLRAAWDAGVVGYDMDLLGRKVVYYGMMCENYIEE